MNGQTLGEQLNVCFFLNIDCPIAYKEALEIIL